MALKHCSVEASALRQQERLNSLGATRAATEEMMGEIATRLGQNEALIQEQMRDGITSTHSVVAFLGKIGDTIEEIDLRQTEAQQDRAAARAELESAVDGLKGKPALAIAHVSVTRFSP